MAAIEKLGKVPTRGNSEAVIGLLPNVQGKSESNTVLMSNKFVSNKQHLIAQTSQADSKEQYVRMTTTEMQSCISEGRFQEEASPLETHGTYFMTEKVSNNPSRKIVQTQENIILSQNSSIKNLD